jgi:hypothetical protein
MKKYLKSILLATVLIFAASCEEDQDVVPAISPDDYSLATMTLTGGSTTFNEHDQPVFVYDIVLSKPLLRSVDISAIQVGGTATLHDDYDVVNATIPAYSTTGQLMVMIYEDLIVEGTETLDLELIPGPSLANAYLLNPATEYPTLNLTIEDYIFCNWTLDGVDSWGDGWNGASVSLTSEGVTTEYAVEASSQSWTIPVTDGEAFSFDFNSGSYDNEITFTLTAPDGTVYSDGPNPFIGTITSGTNMCQ